MAAHDRASRRRCGKGGRLHGLPCDTGQSRRGRHVGPSAFRDRRITTIRIVRLIIEEHLPQERIGTLWPGPRRPLANQAIGGPVAEPASTAFDSSDDCASGFWTLNVPFLRAKWSHLPGTLGVLV